MWKCRDGYVRLVEKGTWHTRPPEVGIFLHIREIGITHDLDATEEKHLQLLIAALPSGSLRPLHSDSALFWFTPQLLLQSHRKLSNLLMPFCGWEDPDMPDDLYLTSIAYG